MKAIVMNQFGGRDVLAWADVPKPECGAGEVLVRVKAAGVNPVDWKIREGWLKEMFPHAFPLIPGWDVAGIVEAVGAQVPQWRPGDEVYAYARKPKVQHGAYAEFIALDAAHVARKPSNLSFEEAASVPLAGLTAWQSLFDAAQLKETERVLIHAAAGGVGSFAVQLARNAGAEVFGTASARNHAFLKELGASLAIDYRTEKIPDVIRKAAPDGLDVVYDCVGGAALEQTPELLRENGRLVTIVDPEVAQRFAEQGLNASFVFVEPNSGQLDALRAQLEDGRLKTHVAAVFPLAEAAKAHELIEQQHTRGKIVLTV